MHTAYEIPVLIAGAGPAGLRPPSTLAPHGVVAAWWSGGAAVEPPASDHRQHAHMEIVRALALEDEVLAGAVDVEWLLLALPDAGPRRRAAAVVDVGLPTRAQARAGQPERSGVRAAGPPRGRARAHLRPLAPARSRSAPS